jgi:hypothetical protein
MEGSSKKLNFLLLRVSVLPWLTLFFFLLVLVPAGCSLFEPRDAEEPSQSGLDFRPPTEPSILIDNLQAAIDQKNLANYTSCFADPSKGKPFHFFPSAEALAQYPSVLDDWTYTDEQAYFQNMMAKTPASAFTNLVLTLRSSSVTADSVVYSYDYTLTIEHSDASFPKTARGNLQFMLAPDRSNFWAIYRWNDYKTTGEVTWSMFKGKFGN